MTSYVYLLACITMLALGQLGFKYVSMNLTGLLNFEPGWIWTGTILSAALMGYLGSTGLWILALRNIPLTIAYPFMALSFAIVPLLALVLFDERVRHSYFAGVALIVAGTIIIGLGSASSSR